MWHPVKVEPAVFITLVRGVESNGFSLSAGSIYASIARWSCAVFAIFVRGCG